MDQESQSRSARKRRAIMDVATALFLRNGYQGTSMDEIAAGASVSKQTVYKNFADKEQLFSDIVLGVTGNADAFVREVPRLLEATSDPERDLGRLARRHIEAVMRPDVLRLRRLVIAEAGRFPELARVYHERAPGRVMDVLASCFADLARRGLLRVDDPRLAAEHFTFLVMGSALDRAMFSDEENPFTGAELDRLADAGAKAFLAVYAHPRVGAAAG